MIEKELNRRDTKMLQALSVMAMLCLHLFDTWGYKYTFTPLLFVGGEAIFMYIGKLCDFCVFGFAFCSGYGHMAQFGKENYYSRRLRGLLSVLISYWTVLVVFSIASIIMGQSEFMPGSWKEFFLNALLIEDSYNIAWWYMLTYAVLILASPVILKAVQRNNSVLVLVLGFAVYCVAYYVRFRVTTDNWLLIKFGRFGMTLFEYLIGAVCYKEQIFTKLYRHWSSIQKPLRMILALALCIGMLYGHTKIVTSWFIAPVTGFVLITLFHFWEKPEWITKSFLFVGGHSTNIWLIHMFFYTRMFKKYVFIAKFSILIFLLVLGITIALSFVLHEIEGSIQRKVEAVLPPL